jgi:hypothetical protein
MAMVYAGTQKEYAWSVYAPDISPTAQPGERRDPTTGVEAVEVGPPLHASLQALPGRNVEPQTEVSTIMDKRTSTTA